MLYKTLIPIWSRRQISGGPLSQPMSANLNMTLTIAITLWHLAITHNSGQPHLLFEPRPSTRAKLCLSASAWRRGPPSVAASTATLWLFASADCLQPFIFCGTAIMVHSPNIHALVCHDTSISSHILASKLETKLSVRPKSQR